MGKENLKEKEAKKLTSEEKIRLADELINQARLTLNLTNDFYLEKPYCINFTIDSIKYQAQNIQNESFSGIYLYRILNNAFSSNIRKKEGISIFKNNHSEKTPFTEIKYIDEGKNISFNTQETVDKIREFLTDFTSKAT